jgi:hypothetical protein
MFFDIIRQIDKLDIFIFTGLNKRNYLIPVITGHITYITVCNLFTDICSAVMPVQNKGFRFFVHPTVSP